MTNFFKTATLAAAAAGTMAMAAPATAAHFDAGAPTSVQTGSETWNQYRDYDNGYRYRDGDRYRGSRNHYNYNNGRTWRGRDGRTYCRRSNGTTGLIVGGAAGALLGREVDGGYNRSTGTILGAAAGALLGRSVDRNRRCR